MWEQVSAPGSGVSTTVVFFGVCVFEGGSPVVLVDLVPCMQQVS